jgi:hypothetical protein
MAKERTESLRGELALAKRFDDEERATQASAGTAESAEGLT